MNYFTESELKILLISLIPRNPDDFPWSKSCVNLYIKIQDMIESYCEHIITHQENIRDCIIRRCNDCDKLISFKSES